MDTLEHKEEVIFTRDGIKSKCSCGAHWSHPINRTEEEMINIFTAHVKYFNNKTSVL